jgi:flavodoxin
MRALVVHESMFGNTQVIANAIADGLSGRMPVDAVEVGVAPASIGDAVGCWSSGGRRTPSG